MSIPELQGTCRELCKRAQRGLFAGLKTGFGNNVSHSVRHTRRTFKPNVFRKRLYSSALEHWVEINVTTKALRCIDKCGGLDNYILNTPPEKLDSERGEELRELITRAVLKNENFH